MKFSTKEKEKPKFIFQMLKIIREHVMKCYAVDDNAQRERRVNMNKKIEYKSIWNSCWTATATRVLRKKMEYWVLKKTVPVKYVSLSLGSCVSEPYYKLNHVRVQRAHMENAKPKPTDRPSDQSERSSHILHT